MATISQSQSSAAAANSQTLAQSVSPTTGVKAPLVDGSLVLAVGNKLIPLSALEANKIKVEAGQKYKIFKSRRPGELVAQEAADNVIATRQGEDLQLRYADGSAVTLESFYAVCTDASICSINLAGDTPAGYTVSGNTAQGVAVEGGSLAYAHGARDVLMAMSEGQAGLLSSLQALGTGSMLSYLPAAVAGMGVGDMLPALLGLGGLAALGGGSGGGGASSTNGNTEPNVHNTVQGQISAGTVLAGNRLTVTLFAADGVTQIGAGSVNADGRFSIDVGSYTGVVMARVNDPDDAPDYLDEATNAGVDLNAVLYAVSVVSGANITVQLNITPLTTVAYHAMGAKPLTVDRVVATNVAVAAAFGLTDIVQTSAVTVTEAGFNRTDGLSEGEAIGVVLAALSGMDLANGGNGQTTIDYLTTQLSASGQQFSSAALLLLLNGAKSPGLASGIYQDLVVVHPNGMSLDLTPAQVSVLTPAEVAAVPVVKVMLLTPAQIAALTPIQVAVLTPAQIAVLTPEKIAAITPAAIGELTPAQVTVLTPAQVAGITSTQIAVLTPAQVAVLTPEKVAAITLASVAALTTVQVAELTTAQVGGLTPTQVAVLAPAQIAAVTPAQIAAIVPAAVAGLTPAQVALLQPAQIAALTPVQVVVLQPEQVAALTPVQVAAITPASVAALTTVQVAELTPAQVGGLTPTQVAVLTPAQVAVLEPAQIAVLTPTQIAAVTPAQIAAIVPAAVAGLTPAQVALLQPEQVAALTPVQVAAITPASVAALTTVQVAELTTAQVGGFTSAQVDVLTTAQVDVLTADQVASITPAAIAGFAPADVAGLSDAQLGALTIPQLVALAAKADLVALNAIQIAALGTDVVALTPTQLGALSDVQLGGLTAVQINALTAQSSNGLSSLTPAQIRIVYHDVGATPPSVALTADSGVTGDNITNTREFVVAGLESESATGQSSGLASWEWQLGVTSGAWTTGVGTVFALPGTVANGVHTVYVRQTDKAGFVSTPGSLEFTLDTAVLSPTVVLAVDSGLVAPDGVTNTRTFTVGGLESGVATTWEWQLDGTAGAWTAGTGTSFTLAGTVVDGTHSVFVRQTDTAGNVSASGTSGNITLDTQAPAVASRSTGTIAPTAPLVIAFNETVRAGSGDVVIYRSSDNNVVETLSVTDAARVSIAGGVVTITPSSSLTVNTDYYVKVATTAFVDVAGNAYAGEVGTSWSFTASNLGSSVVMAGSGIDLSNGLNQAEIASNSLALSGQIFNTGGATGIYIDGIVFVSDDGLSNFSISSGLLGPLNDQIASGSMAWTLANDPAWAGQFVSGKAYHVSVALAGTLGGSGTTGSGTSGAVLVDMVAPTQTATVTAITDDVGLYTSPVLSGGVTDDTQVSLTGTLSTAIATTDTLRIYDGALYLGNAVVSGTGWTFADTRVLVDGEAMSYTARVSDAAGNQSAAAAAFTATVDTTPPAQTATVTAITDDVGSIQGAVASGGVTDDTQLAIAGTLSVAIGATDTVRVYDGAAYLGNAVVSGSNWTYADSRVLVDGEAVSYTARVSDAAGNQSSATAAYTATVDNGAPAQTALVTAITDNVGLIQGVVANGGMTDDAQLTISGTLSAVIGGGDTVRIYDGSTYLGTATVTSTTWSYVDTRTLVDGAVLSYTAQVINAAGTLGTATAAYAATVDTTAPAQVATVTAITDNVGQIQGAVTSGGVTDDTQLAVAGTLSAAIAATDTVRVYDGGAYLGNAVVTGTTWTYADSRTLINLQAVSYTARVSDVAGNLSAVSADYTAMVDTVAPTQTAIVTAISDDVGIHVGTIASGDTTDDTQLAIAGTLSESIAAADMVRIYDGATYLGNAVISGTTWTYVDVRTLANAAALSYTARVSDVAGNQSAATAAYTATVDTVAPTQTATVTAITDDVGIYVGIIASGGVTNDTQLAIAGTLNVAIAATDTVRIYDGAAYLGNAVVSGTNWTYVDVRTLVNAAALSYTARVSDAAGNQSAAAAAYTATVDTVAPTQTATATAITDDVGIHVGTISSGGMTDDTQLTIAGTLSVAIAATDMVRIYDAAAYLGNAVVSGTGWTYADTRTLTDGATPSYTALVADSAGNLGTASAAYTATVDTTAPTPTATVTAITDNVGLIQGEVASGGMTDDTQLAIAGTLSAAIAGSDTVRIYDGAAYLGNAVVSTTNWTYVDTRTLVNGEALSYTARVSDTVGNQSAAAAAFTATVDTIAPTQTATVAAITDDVGIYVSTVASGSVTDDTQLAIAGILSVAIDATDRVRIYDGAVYLGNAIVSGTGWTYADTRTLADGAVPSYTALVSDAAGNAGTVSAAYTATVDTVAPTQTATVTAITDNVGSIQGAVASGGRTDDTQLAIAGTLSAGLDTNNTVRIYDGALYLGNAVVSSTNWTYADTRALVNNQTLSYTAQVSDVAGNQSAATTAYTATVDTVAPTQIGTVTAIVDNFGITQGTVASSGFTDDTQVSLTGILSAAIAVTDTVHVYDGAAYLGDAVVSGTGWTYVDSRTLLDNETVSFNVHVSDAAGNAGTSSVAYTATVDTGLPAVQNTAVVDSITNFDVQSNIVLTFGEAVTARAGGLITLVNDANSGTKIGYVSESFDHSLNFYMGASTVSGGVTTVQTYQNVGLTVASGTLIISATGVVSLNPLFDLDLSNNYHIDISANTFVSGMNGAGNAAYSGMHFETVTPGTVTVAAESLAMTSAGATASSYWWAVMDGLGSLMTAVDVDASAHNYAFVAKNVDTPMIYDANNNPDPTKGQLGTETTNVRFNNFTLDAADILYFDTQANDGVDRDFFYENSYAADTARARFNLAPSYPLSEGGQSWFEIATYRADEIRLPTSVIEG